MNLIEEKMFGGEDGIQFNVLMQTFRNCAKNDDRSFYDYLERCPKTSLVVELVDEINRLGYKITKIKEH